MTTPDRNGTHAEPNKGPVTQPSPGVTVPDVHSSEEHRIPTPAEVIPPILADSGRRETGEKAAKAESESARPEPDGDASKREIKEDIQRTRAELGETVEAPASKLDVKERSRQVVEETRDRAMRAADDAKERALHAAEEAKERVGQQVHDLSDRVSQNAEHLKQTMTDVEGKPNVKGWLVLAGALAAVAATAAFIVAINRRR